MKYYIKCDSQYVVYSEPDPYDDWDQGEDGYEAHEFTVSTETDGYPDETFDTDIEKPYFIAVIYSTGCTFGTTYGVVQYLGPFTKEKGEKIHKQLEDSNGDNYEGLEGDNKYFYPYWIGYFENYQESVLLEG